MKKEVYKYAILIIALLFNVLNLYGQETKITTRIRATPTRAAEGQTKWMINQYKLESSKYSELYNINLRYHSAMDSIHSTGLKIEEKRKLYELAVKYRDESLKKTLPKDSYQSFVATQAKIKESLTPTEKVN
jgi:hypothetical protein